MPNRNIQRRVAPWFRSLEPVVIYVDEHTIEATKRSKEVFKGPDAPGFWWSADAGWTGPFETYILARTAGRDFLARVPIRRHG